MKSVSRRVPRWAMGLVAAGVLAGAGAGAFAQQVECEEFVLENGMKFILCPRQEPPNIIAAGWLAKVGSVNERPGITGISHFFEHMMFKGTNTIGTEDPEADREFRLKQKQVRDELMDLILTENYQRWREGVIDDPWDPENFTPEMSSLRQDLIDLMDAQKGVTVNNEFDQVYTEFGASGMNAFTSNDMTFYFINVPSNKFELWAWMESDRLSDSVFREFYAERDVVHEERRLRTESTPTGVYQEQFDAMFWQSSPYSWPVIGWTSDLNAYTMEQAKDYYATYYQPSNIVGFVVGDFQADEVRPVIEEYFSRLSPTGREVPPVVTTEMPQLAEKRMIAECDCQPQVDIRYHTVPFGHADSYALEVLAEVLNGRTGRLYKSMIEGAEVASSAFAMQSSRGFGAPAKYEGYFAFGAETKGDATPEQLEQAWYEQVELLKSELVGERELQKVKNGLAADSYRRLQSNFFLLVQLGMYENMGGWEQINEHPAMHEAVTAEDIQRVAETYFTRENRTVGLYYREAGSAPMDPELAEVLEGLPPQVADGIKGQIKRIASFESAEELGAAIAQMEAQAGQVPEQFAKVFQYMLEKSRERLAELEGGE